METQTSTEIEPLVFRGALSEADVVEIRRCMDRLLVRRSIRWTVYGVASFIAALSVGVVLFRRIIGFEAAPLRVQVIVIVALIGWAYVLFGIRLERDWMTRRQYRRNAGDYRKTEVTLTSEGVSIANEVLRSEFRWSLVKFLADAPSGMMLGNSASQALVWLPARLFEGDWTRDRVRALAEANGVRVRRVR